jgi:hypothetical protein
VTLLILATTVKTYFSGDFHERFPRAISDTNTQFRQRITTTKDTKSTKGKSQRTRHLMPSVSLVLLKLISNPIFTSGGFQQIRPQFAMNFDGTADHTIGERAKFHPSRSSCPSWWAYLVEHISEREQTFDRHEL